MGTTGVNGWMIGGRAQFRVNIPDLGQEFVNYQIVHEQFAGGDLNGCRAGLNFSGLLPGRYGLQSAVSDSTDG